MGPSKGLIRRLGKYRMPTTRAARRNNTWGHAFLSEADLLCSLVRFRVFFPYRVGADRVRGENEGDSINGKPNIPGVRSGASGIGLTPRDHDPCVSRSLGRIQAVDTRIDSYLRHLIIQAPLIMAFLFACLVDTLLLCSLFWNGKTYPNH